MFFYIAKIFWFFAAPTNALIIASALAAALAFAGRVRVARWLAGFVAAGFLVFGLGPGGLWLIAPLENRFPPARLGDEPPAGILVLGGGMDENLSEVRGIPILTESGGRMTEAASLAHRYPTARLVFSGGSAHFRDTHVTESDAARQLFTALGIAPGRMSFEDRSRDTYENALFSLDLVKPKPGERWLLVTSAFHMPRSIAIFRKLGFPVEPWPADYYSSGQALDALRLQYQASIGLRMTDVALREWVGLVAYRLSGRTDTLLPGP